MIVVDASIVLKWLMPHEPLAEGALAIRQGHTEGRQPCACPDLLLYEVANALITKSRVPLEEAATGLALVLRDELIRYPFEDGNPGYALRVAREHHLSLYDAAYVALAKRLECDLVTADRQLYQRTRDLTWVKYLN